MANEISISAALSFRKTGVTSDTVGRAVTDLLATVTGDYWTSGVFLADVLPQPLPLGQVSSPHWCWFKNLDGAATIWISNGADTPFLMLKPGEGCPVPVDSSIVPYTIASVAAFLEYVIISR